MSNAASSANKYYLEKEIEGIISYLRETGDTERVKIKRWGHCELGLGTPKEQVSTKVRQDARDKCGWTGYKLNYITEVLAEEGFTDSNLSGHKGTDNRTSENLQVLKESSAISVLNGLGKEELQDVYQQAKVLKEHCEFVASSKGTALIGHEERESKKETQLPKELETDYYFAMLDLAEQAKEFYENVLGVAKKIKQFPILDQEKNREKALKTRALAQFFYGYNQRLLPSLKDEKWAFSDWEWFQVAVREEQYSKHGAAVKSKVEALDKDGNPTGIYRPLTRERISDSKEELYQDMKDVALSMDIHAWMIGACEWRDISGQVSGRVAQRRINLSPDLSEKAIG